MQMLPDAGNGRPLALSLLLGVCVLIGWWLYDSLIVPHLEIAQAIEQLQERELRYRKLAAQGPLIDKRLADVEAFRLSNPAFLEEKDFDSAAAGLTQRLKEIVTNRAKTPKSCVINSMSSMRQNNQPSAKVLFEQASVRVGLNCAWEEFAHILHDIENNSPALFVDEFQVFKQMDYRMLGSNQVGNPPSVSFKLSGYLRNNTTPPKSANP
jgi:general secretion pathway protein M